jgi:23S rRNA pseudouridine1911/1915/1917 synthase
MLVAVKPAGLPTANAPRGRPSLFTLVQAHLPRGAFVGVVSRLDAPVSGLVVMAKTRAAAADLAGQFRERTVEKTYQAVCTGRFPAPLGQWVEWRDDIARPAEDGSDSVARPASTRARVLKRGGEVSLVELVPATGRRHQLRVQLGDRGCPIVGDRLYGSRMRFADGIALHAAALAFAHPRTGRPVTCAAAPPPAWKQRFPMLFKPRGR